MPKETEAQRKARLNPTPFMVSTPKNTGFFRAVGDYGTAIYKMNPDGRTYQAYDILNELGGGGASGNAGGQAGVALQKLKAQYGIDFNALPQQNLGDLLYSGKSAGGNPFTDRATPVRGNLADLFTPQPSLETGNQIINTAPNVLASPSATPQPLAVSGETPSVSLNPNANWFGAFPTSGLPMSKATPSTSGAISSDTLGSSAQINLPTVPTLTTPNITGGQAQIDSFNKLFEQARKEQQKSDSTELSSRLQEYIDSSKKPPLVSEQYKTDYVSAGIDTKQTEFNVDRAKVKTAQGKLAAVNAQLAGVIADAQAIQIQAQKDAEGRGITTGGLAPLTTAQLRNNALKAIPLQSQALIAQAEVASAQGDAELSQDILNQAQTHLDKIFQIHQTDSTNRYNYEKDLRDKVYDFATAQEKTKLDRISKKADQDFQLMMSNLKDAQSSKNLAIENGQGALASQIASLDPRSPSYFTDLAKLQGQLKQKADFQFVSGTENQPAGVFDKTTATFRAFGGGDGKPTVTTNNPQAQQYASALNTILGSGKFTKDQSKAVVNAINNGEDPFTVVKNQAKTLLGQTGDTKLTAYEVAKEQLVAVRDSLTRYYALGGKTNIFSGNYENVINKLGTVNDPKLVEIATEIAASLQIYRNAVSGTAYSVQEGVDIAKIFPGINKTEGLNTAILNGRMKAFDSTIDSTYGTVLGKSYDELKKANTHNGINLPPFTASSTTTYQGITLPN